MPLFEYRCQRCGYEFEAFVTAARQAACPSCDSQQLEKRVSPPARLAARGGSGGYASFGGG